MATIKCENNLVSLGRTKKPMNDEANSMAQWVERNQSNHIINLPSLPLLSEISGVTHVVLLGSYSRQAKFR